MTPTLTRSASGLLGAAHPGPAAAVTLLAGLLAVVSDLTPTETTLVVLATAAGQLSIGWSNDLVDAARDRQVGRTDKPIARGTIDERTVRVACAAALTAAVPLHLLTGLASGLVGLLVVAGGWAYNLGLKATAASWAPYAVAFGALPVFVHLAGHDALPPAWVPVAGALLGVGAHFVNVVPDLADDAATGVRGLPHRLGARGAQAAATVVLVAASAVIAVGADGGVAAYAALVVVGVLGAAALLARGRAPFRAAVGIALVDVAMLVIAR